MVLARPGAFGLVVAPKAVDRDGAVEELDEGHGAGAEGHEEGAADIGDGSEREKDSIWKLGVQVVGSGVPMS